LIDISVPRNIYIREPISGVSTFDVDDLQEVVNKNNEARMKFAK
jgi:glutamyl-tRNA reductase